MKVLSVIEPWASLICYGGKRIETRSWKTNYRGELYIHASKKPISPKDPDMPRLLDHLPDHRFYYGCIIGKCRLADCRYMDEEFLQAVERDPKELLMGNYALGRYGWMLTDIVLLAEPVPARGSLGIWNFEPK